MATVTWRWGSFWEGEQPNQVKLVEDRDVFDKIAYAAANPVTAQLVEHAEHWPGMHTTAAFFSGEELEVERPAHFFREEGPTPERVTLRLAWPEHLGQRAIARACSSPKTTSSWVAGRSPRGGHARPHTIANR